MAGRFRSGLARASLAERLIIIGWLIVVPILIVNFVLVLHDSSNFLAWAAFLPAPLAIAQWIVYSRKERRLAAQRLVDQTIPPADPDTKV